MTRFHFGLVAAVLLATPGCASTPTGVFLVMQDASEPPLCETVIDDNFKDSDSQTSDTSSDWTTTITETSSGSAYYVEMVPLDGGSWVLNYGGSLATGVENEDGTWKFSWEDIAESVTDSEHDEGYWFEVADLSSDRIEFDVVLPDKDVPMSGTIASRSVQENRWVESDEWDDRDVDVAAGQIPAGLYLVDDNDRSLSNDPNEEDCSDDDCEIVVSTTCTASATFVAYETNGDSAGDYLLPVNAAGSGSSL
jgi:hypothetical protein